MALAFLLGVRATSASHAVNGGCPVVVEVDGSRAIEDCALCSVTLAPVIARAVHWLVVLNRNQNLLS
jgi:hypothetical protein